MGTARHNTNGINANGNFLFGLILNFFIAGPPFMICMFRGDAHNGISYFIISWLSGAKSKVMGDLKAF